jgi:hypothetical protein
MIYPKTKNLYLVMQRLGHKQRTLYHMFNFNKPFFKGRQTTFQRALRQKKKSANLLKLYLSTSVILEAIKFSKSGSNPSSQIVRGLVRSGREGFEPTPRKFCLISPKPLFFSAKGKNQWSD